MIFAVEQKGEKMGRLLDEDDVVSRQAVYTVIEEVLYETTKGADNWYGLLNDGVRTLPSAQQERNTGEWIKVKRCEEDTQPNLKCPFCGNIVGWFDLAKYCAGCGAKLEGGAG